MARVSAPVAALAAAFLALSVAQGAVRGPIMILGDAGFTRANGVTGGSGTAEDPFLINGWDVAFGPGKSAAAVSLAKTTAHVVVRNVTAQNGHIQLVGCSNVRLESVTVVSVGWSSPAGRDHGVHGGIVLEDVTTVSVASSYVGGVGGMTCYPAARGNGSLVGVSAAGILGSGTLTAVLIEDVVVSEVRGGKACPSGEAGGDATGILFDETSTLTSVIVKSVSISGLFAGAGGDAPGATAIGKPVAGGAGGNAAGIQIAGSIASSVRIGDCNVTGVSTGAGGNPAPPSCGGCDGGDGGDSGAAAAILVDASGAATGALQVVMNSVTSISSNAGGSGASGAYGGQANHGHGGNGGNGGRAGLAWGIRVATTGITQVNVNSNRISKVDGGAGGAGGRGGPGVGSGAAGNGGSSGDAGSVVGLYAGAPPSTSVDASFNSVQQLQGGLSADGGIGASNFATGAGGKGGNGGSGGMAVGYAYSCMRMRNGTSNNNLLVSITAGGGASGGAAGYAGTSPVQGTGGDGGDAIAFYVPQCLSMCDSAFGTASAIFSGQAGSSGSGASSGHLPANGAAETSCEAKKNTCPTIR